MPVDVAVLDVDGTVATCPYDFDAMRAAVASIGARHAVDTRALGVRGIIEQIERASSALGDGGAQFREEAEAAVTAIETEAARGSVLVPGAVQALAQLRRRGVAVALITRNCRAATDLVLSEFGEYDVLLTRDDVPRSKPDPDHVLRALAALDRTPGGGVLAGDHAYDIQAGRAAGMRYCVGVRTGTGSDESLLEAGADSVLESVADLPSWLLDTAGEGRP
jgi:phosphoglycolate phosphatase